MKSEKLERSRALSLIFIGIVMMVTTCAQSAFSADMKAFPATMCITKGSFVSNGLNYLTRGAVFNASSSTTQSVICPVVRDQPTAPYIFIKVVVVDNHPSLNISCEVHANSRSGDTSNKTAVLSTTGASSSAKILTFAPIAEHDYGSYTIACTIPPVDPLAGNASGIGSYLISEP